MLIPPHTPTGIQLTGKRHRRVPGILATIGLAITVLGVGAEFALERHSFYSTQDFLFTFLDRISLPTLFVGIGLGFAGAVAWVRTFSRGKQLAAAAILFGVGLLVYASSLNIHDWTGSLIPVVLALWALGLLLAVMAVARRG